MSTLEERLREELAHAVAPVRPEPDPYARLLRRRRQRSWRWGGATLVAAVLAGAVGLQALLAPAGPSPSPDPEPPVLLREPTDAALDHWGRDIIAAATRGDAAKDPALTDALRAALDHNRGPWSIRPELDRIKILYIVDVGPSRAFAAAFYNDERAQFVAAAAPAGSGAEELVSGRYGLQSGQLEPFTLGGDAGRYTIAMVPPGCLAAPSTATRVGPDASLRQDWARGAEFVVEDKPALPRWWKVSCAGEVRELLLAGGDGPHDQPPNPPTAERGQADPDVVAQLLRNWPGLPGLDVGAKRILWGGTPQGEHRPVAVGIAQLADRSVVVVAATGKGDAYLVTAARPDADLEGPPTDRPPARITTAVSPSADLVAIRLPAEDHLALSDRMLVIAPPDATRLLVSTGSGAPLPVTLDHGVGVIHAPIPAKITIRAVDPQGNPLAETTIAEPRDAPRILAGQGLIRNWA